MDSCNITNKVNSRTLKLEIHTRPKLYPVGGNVSKAMLFLFKKCRPGYQAGAFIWENFQFSVKETDISVSLKSKITILTGQFDFFW